MRLGYSTWRPPYSPNIAQTDTVVALSPFLSGLLEFTVVVLGGFERHGVTHSWLVLLLVCIIAGDGEAERHAPLLQTE